MAYHVYESEAIVLGSAPRGEANRIYSLYTEEAGLILATAQGVRHLKSKLKHHLQDLSLSRIAFVRGKEFWRITNVRGGDESLLSGEGKLAFARIAALLKRLLHGEDKNHALFNALKVARSYLQSAESKERVLSVELVSVMKILHALGYISPKDAGFFLEDPGIAEGDLSFVGENKERMLGLVNKALKESQL